MIIQNKPQISRALNEPDHKNNINNGSSVQNAKDGKVSRDIWDITMDCTVQQDMGSSTVYTEAQARQLSPGSEEMKEVGSMSSSEFLSRSLTGQDAQALSDEETPLEQYTSSQLERAVNRVKEQRSETRQAVDRQVEKEREKEEALEQNALRNAISVELVQKLESQLEQSDLPVTPESVAHLAHAVELSEELGQFSQNAMKFFIGNEWSITPEHINGSVYSGVSAAGNVTGKGDDSFDSVRSQVEQILQEDGISVTDESMETAKWLYDNQLAVTADNVRAYQQIEQIKELDPDTIIERIVDNLADGVEAEHADLTKISRREAGEAVQGLISTEDSRIRQVYPSEIEFLRAKRQIEEIRLSMTAEAARSMAAKGIDLDIKNLEQIVDELRAQEQQAKESWLIETGLPVSEENTELLHNTVTAARNVLAAPVDLLANSMRMTTVGTLGELSDSAVALKDQYDRMERTYETVGTEVRRDLGDSIKKAFGNVDDILEDLGFEKTAMNQRAVRILGYNRMELTAENIENMKAYDEKVTTLMENLRPQVAAELIRRQINPLAMSIDELNDAVMSVREDMQVDDISFRKFMWKMDHQGDMSEEERKSLIGVYRLLDKIEKSDGAVVGRVIKEGRELSLSSLLSATRTGRAEGLDVEVDDEFGGLVSVNQSGTAIDDQIMAAYQSSLAGKLKQHFSPAKMSELGQAGMEQSLESLLEEMTDPDIDAGKMQEYYEQIAGELSSAMDDPEGEVLSFLKSLDLPDHAMNRLMAQGYMASEWNEMNRLWKKEESERLLEAFDQPEELNGIYDQFDTVHEKEIADLRESDDITYDGVVSLARMAGGISFYRSLRSRQTYEVPIVTERGITTCNVTIRSGGQKKGTVEISVESGVLGMVQASFRVAEKHVKGFVTAEREENIQKCQDILTGFEKDLEENGFTMESDNLVQGNRRFLHQINDTKGNTKNQDLYQVAKCFIKNIAGKDE